MPRPDKVQAVAEIKERMERAQAVFLAEYSGLSVKDQQTLRRSLRAGGAEFKVVKMTLARRAAAELELTGVDELLLGPTGLTFADGDPVTAAKALKDFAKDHEVFAIKGGLLGTDLLTPERVSELAEIEPREVLLAKIAGAFQAPMANMAGLLAAMPRNFASMVKQLIDKREPDETPAPVEAAVAEEAGSDEPAAAADEAPAEESAEASSDATEEAADDSAADAEDVVAAEAEDAPADDEADAEAPAAAADEAPVEDAPAAGDADDDAPAEEVKAADAKTETGDTDSDESGTEDDEPAQAAEEE